MKLSKLLERLDYTCLQGDMNKEITGIYNDSRKVTDGSLFLCIKGAVSDGHTYAAQVSEKGATVIVVQDPVEVPESVTVIQVEERHCHLYWENDRNYIQPHLCAVHSGMEHMSLL